VIAFVALHVFLYAGATAFNSYYDRDEGPVGGLERPPPVLPALLPVALGMSLFVTRAVVMFMGRFVPLNETFAKRRGELVGCVGEAVFGINEAFGMALLEAQASALPVVAGNTGGVADIVVPEITGVLVPAGDPVAFAAALGALLRDPVLRRRMGKAARDNVWRDHDLAPAASRLAAALTRLGPAKAA